MKTKPGNGNNGRPALAKVTTLRAIVPELQRHYRGKLLYEITPQNISDWRRGRNILDPDAPLFPGKEGNYHLISNCIKWFDKHVLPYWSADKSSVEASSNNDVFTRVEIARLRQEDDREELIHKKFLREQEQGRHIRKAMIAPLALGVGKKLSAALTKAEKTLPFGLAADLKQLDVPEQLRNRIVEKFSVRCRLWNDRLQSEIPKRLLEIQPEEPAEP